MTETSRVTVEVTDLTRISGRGKLIGLAQVEILVDGVEIITQGWRLVRRADGFTTVEQPVYRHADGDWVPAVVLPVELEEAIAQAILDEADATMPGAS